MTYNKEMEQPRRPISEMLGPNLQGAMKAADNVRAAEIIQGMATEQTERAGWAEAIGVRLQLRDFCVTQKGAIARLQPEQGSSLEVTVKHYLQAADHQLLLITGGHGRHETDISGQTLKNVRIGRMSHELQTRTPASATEFLRYFSGQDANDYLPADVLAQRAVTVRQAIVESLWPAAQAEYESAGRSTAERELMAAGAEVNNQLDDVIGQVLRWDN